MKFRLRHISARSVFLLFLTLYGIVGLLVGLLLTAVTTLGLPTGAELTAVDRLGAWSLLVFPLAYGLVAGLAGAIAAVLYNLAAAISGGIELDLARSAPRGGWEPAEPRAEEPGAAAPASGDAGGRAEGAGPTDEEDAGEAPGAGSSEAPPG